MKIHNKLVYVNIVQANERHKQKVDREKTERRDFKLETLYGLTSKRPDFPSEGKVN